MSDVVRNSFPFIPFPVGDLPFALAFFYFLLLYCFHRYLMTIWADSYSLYLILPKYSKWSIIFFTLLLAILSRSFLAAFWMVLAA